MAAGATVYTPFEKAMLSWNWPVEVQGWGMMPRWIGVLLWLHGFAHIALSFTGMLGPQYVDAVARYTTPIRFAEPVLMLWLLVMGTKEAKADAGLLRG